MGIAIIITFACLLIGWIMMFKYINIVMVAIGMIILLAALPVFMIGGTCAYDKPIDKDMPYYIGENELSKTIDFSEYAYDGNNIKIPAYYYVEYGWVNSWKYCETPITVVVPKGKSVKIKEWVPKSDDKIRIVGGCD
jgi:hypothetical protein